ncbi:MAG: YaeQ family protein [Gammaproteobacteria bacterium]|nr:YaeQ family protein [Gammaproteobacteria bacterium]
MALKATVYKAELVISDVDRGYYGTHALTLARHPSETEERLMLRVLAFAMHADAALEFGRGLSTEDEPDLWLMDATGRIELWIDLGLPDEKRLRRAAGRAGKVVLLTYGERAFEVWWRRNKAACSRLPALTVWTVTDAALDAVATLASRNMQLQLTLQDGQIAMADGERYLEVAMSRIQT